MKGILCACLLALLQSLSVARAYEADVHFSTTYVLARAVGWTEADALTIASANQGVDENHDTVAALEVATAPSASLAGYATSSLRQAEKNLRFHCFSSTRGQPGKIGADVLEVMSGHFARVPGRADDPRRNARRLIALGAALHCQQDAHAHVDFGGSCGSHPGSCLGHTHETLLDQVVFGLLKKHHYNPDHPGVSGPRLLEALQGTVRELTVRLSRTSARPVPAQELVALSDALRASGLELPDDVRRDCNRNVVGKWLFDFLHSRGRTHDGPGKVEQLAPAVAGACRNPSLASARIVSIPAPRFPRLHADASPYLVKADGTYELARADDTHVSLPAIHAEVISGLIPNYRGSDARVQLSHWRHLLALPLITQITRPPPGAPGKAGQPATEVRAHGRVRASP